MHFADASVWITCAMTLAACDISKVVENGTVVEPVVEYTGGTIRYAFVSCFQKVHEYEPAVIVIRSRLNAPSSHAQKWRRSWFLRRSKEELKFLRGWLWLSFMSQRVCYSHNVISRSSLYSIDTFVGYEWSFRSKKIEQAYEPVSFI